MGNLSMHALCGLLLVSLYLQHLPIVSTQGPPGSPARRGPPRSTTAAPQGGASQTGRPASVGRRPEPEHTSGPEPRTRDDRKSQDGDMDHQRSEEHGESPSYPGMRPPPIAGAPGPIYGGQNDRHRPKNQPDAPECERKEKEQHSERSFRNEGHRQAPERRMRRPMHWPMRGIYGNQWQYEMSRDYHYQWNYDREYYGWQSQMQNRDEEEDEDCEDEEFERDIYSDGDRYDYPMDDCDGHDGHDDGECMHRPRNRRMGMDGYFDDMDYYYYTMYKYYNMVFGPYSLMTPPYLCPCMWQRPMMPPRHLPPRRRRSSRPSSRDCSTPATQSPPHTWHSPLLCDVRSLDTGNVLVNVTCNDGFVCVNTNQTECSNVTISICIHENCTGMSYHDSKVCTMRKVKEDAEGKENDDMRRSSGQRDGRGGRQCRNRYKGGQRGYGSGRESGRGGIGGNDEGESRGSGERGGQESSDNDRMRDGKGDQANSKLGDDMEKKYLKCLGLI